MAEQEGGRALQHQLQGGQQPAQLLAAPLWQVRLSTQNWRKGESFDDRCILAVNVNPLHTKLFWIESESFNESCILAVNAFLQGGTDYHLPL